MKYPKIFTKIRRVKGFTIGVICTLSLMLFIQARTGNNYFEISKNLEIYATIFKELNAYYVDPIEPGKMVKTSVDAMLHDLDPYTNYITESDIEDYEFMTTGKYGGIGASLRKKDDNIYVGDVYENSPANKAGIHSGDQIISIDGNAVKGKTIEEISPLLKGSPGTSLKVIVKEAYSGQEATKNIVRGEIAVSSVPYSGLVGVNKDIAFVKLNQFTPNCSKLVRDALDSLKTVNPKLQGVVLDLRNNPGGLLDEAVNLCNLFIDRNQLVVTTKGKMQDWDKSFKTNGSPWDLNIPVAVLINHSSASASEIVSGTLQDLDRGVVIGQRSYGKGLVQVTRPLGYNASLKLTTARYYTPSGRCIQEIDYSHRNADGSVEAVADSLKKTFKTKGGRKVLSGGGITPDIMLKSTDLPKICIAIYNKNYFFDYATQYAKSHPTIPSADVFSLSSIDYEAFVKWLEGKDYSYKSTTETMLDSLQKTAEKEQFYESSKAEFLALKNKISHDKKQDLQKNTKEVKNMLENEIISRYYFLRGRIVHTLRSDEELAKAINILSQKNTYDSILKQAK